MQFFDRPVDKDSGPADVRYVVLHHTGGAEAGDYATLWGDAEVSIHYLIGKTGNVYYGVRLGRQAWHCYPSWWEGLINLNRYSIGIELCNMGDNLDPWPPAQLAALDKVLNSYIRPLYGNLPAVRHRDISAAIGKTDPADNFPWGDYSGGIAQVAARLTVTGGQLSQGDDMAQPIPMNKDLTKWQGYQDFTAFPEACLLIAVSSGDAPGVPEPQGQIAEVRIYTAGGGSWMLDKIAKIGNAGPTLIWRKPGYNGQVVVDSDGPSIVVQAA